MTLGIVNRAERSCSIPPNSEVTIRGFLDKPISYQPTCAILQPTRDSFIPRELCIAPGLWPCHTVAYERNV